jgi:hypothetical protein
VSVLNWRRHHNGAHRHKVGTVLSLQSLVRIIIAAGGRVRLPRRLSSLLLCHNAGQVSRVLLKLLLELALRLKGLVQLPLHLHLESKRLLHSSCTHRVSAWAASSHGHGSGGDCANLCRAQRGEHCRR